MPKKNKEQIEAFQFALNEMDSSGSFQSCFNRFYQNYGTSQTDLPLPVFCIKGIGQTPPTVDQEGKFGMFLINYDETMWFRSSFFNVLGVSPSRCFCTRVRGESMHPTLIDRGTVLWQMQNSYTIEGIYLFRQVNELRIKRLQRVNSHTFRIISDNKEFYPIETLDLRDMESHEFEIYGKYLWDCAIRP